jgi:hypothetical protein
MTIATCPHCRHDHLPPGDRPPPWCCRCGGDLRPAAPAPPPAVDEPVALTAAPPEGPAPDGRWSRQPHRSNPHAAAAVPPTAALLPPPPPDRPLDPDRAFREVYGRDRDAAPPVPAWGYLFIGACGIIPVLTLGGGIPMLLGAGGASLCLKVCRARHLDGVFKFAACVGITAVAWVGLGATLMAVGMAQAKLAHGR